ncbi:MAG: sugar porter family MFS transporter [Actinobacteria bacterium]|nr:sugar porter family MFS transporter [Actinomycetota bacterium]
MSGDGRTQADAASTSGIEYIRFAASGRNRFVTLIALLAALGGFLFGYDTGIIGQALPFVQKQFHASTVVASWIVASVLIGAIVGAAGSGYLADRISRKWTKFCSGCVFVAGALLEATAQSATWLIIARFILGLAVGTASFVSPEYIAEQTPPRIRGGTVSYNQLMITLGILLAYVAGFGLAGAAGNWRWMLGLGAIPGALLAISMIFVPHTPRWLVSKGRTQAARDVLEHTRTGTDVQAELHSIQDVVAKERRTPLRELIGARVRPMLVIGVALAIIQQFVGINTVIYFTTTILKYTGSSTSLSVQQAVYVGLTNFVLTVVAILCMDWLGRRVILITGSVVATVALIALGVYFQFTGFAKADPWFGLACVIVYIAGFAFSLGPVFWLMISEIFPLQHRSKAMALCTIFNWAANFIVSYFFLQEVGLIGKPATFWIYAFVGVLATGFIWLRVPETKAKPLEQIEREAGARSGRAA